MRFWSTVSKRGTHRTESFFACKYSCKILWTWLIETLAIITDSRTFTRRLLFNAALWMFSMISSIIAVLAQPVRSSLKMDEHIWIQQPISLLLKTTVKDRLALNFLKRDILLRGIQLYPFFSKYTKTRLIYSTVTNEILNVSVWNVTVDHMKVPAWEKSQLFDNPGTISISGRDLPELPSWAIQISLQSTLPSCICIFIRYSFH